MRVLIISHNVFSATESMGKTLSGYFADFEPNQLAQFYIHSQVPTTSKCRNYYRMTDKEAIKSIVGVPCGTVFGLSDIQPERDSSRTDKGVTASIYQKARKRTPAIYMARNLWWKFSHWDTKQFRDWLDTFDPECVFFASGDYGFMYDISWKIAKERNIPLYIVCMDDYYFYNKNQDSMLGRWQHKLFMKSVKRAIAFSSKLFCICDKMTEDYATFFRKPCVTIHTPSSIEKQLAFEKKTKISYLGNLGFLRHQQLIDIGQALKKLGMKPDHVDVYSTESRKEILVDMTEENGIVFHGPVGADEVLKIMGESLAVIHTESFDERTRQSVRYSVSTKIADSLASGTCIFAYGPEEIASIDYLNRANAAVCCTNKDDLAQKLKALITVAQLRDTVIHNALNLAARNHAKTCTPEIIKRELQEQ